MPRSSKTIGGREYHLTYSYQTGVGYWLTVKQGRPTRCSNWRICGHRIQIGDRFLYRHTPRSHLCLDCAAGVEYKISERARVLIKQSRRAGEPRIAINAQRIINLLDREGWMTKQQIGMALSLGSSLDRHMKFLLRSDLASKRRIDSQRVEWFLTPKGKALADPDGVGFPALVAPAPEPQAAPEPLAIMVPPRRGVIRLSGKRRIAS